jgi:hypothetical protein
MDGLTGMRPDRMPWMIPGESFSAFASIMSFVAESQADTVLIKRSGSYRITMSLIMPLEAAMAGRSKHPGSFIEGSTL